MISRQKRKRLEVKLDARRTDLRRILREEAEKRNLSPAQVAVSSTITLLRGALQNLEAAQARAELARDLAELRAPLSVEAVTLAMGPLLNLALSPQVALECLLERLDDASFEALLQDLERGDFQRLPAPGRRR